MNSPVKSNLPHTLPDVDTLPDSDDIPVDNEDQNFLPNVLLFLLKMIWADRQDWYFGVDMGVYHTTGENPRVPVVPDAFLSIGIPRRRNNKSRRSYITWKENDIPPMLTLEMVSWCPGGEYDEKMEIYQKLGVLYYVIYNPEFWQRDQHHPFEVYKLIDGDYQLQLGEPFWMPEIGLGLGRFHSPALGGPEEGLCWFDKNGTRYLLAEEQRQQESDRAQEAADRADRLAAKLRELGEDPDLI